ncbi:MAG TPA: hypothetical protein VFQ29_11620, partial [Methyloceanibacter sp.]|nr:hypothetical protein [Methyloceanibacter sp.]
KKALAELESVNAELRTAIASQSDALKTARTTLHNQRADIDRLRAALEGGGGGGLRGLGKPDARTLAESQRLSAELSKAQEELQRARTSAEENGLLRRELSRLGSQILAVARAQGLAAPQVAVVEEVFVERRTHEEPPLPEQDLQAQHGNGAAAEADDAGNGVDSVAARMAGADLAPPEDEEDAEEAREEPKSFARKFVARREARRARKGGGTSLRDRLRGLTAERPDR